MKLLLACISEANLPWLEMIRDTDLHILGWYDSEAAHQRLRELFPAGRKISNRAEFDKATTNCVTVFGTGNDLSDRESLLRDLARDSAPIATIHPVCSAIFAAELDMIQRDTNAPIVPLHPACFHPAIDFLADACQSWSSDSPIGKIEQIVVERQSDDRSDDNVKSLLARDALILRKLIGEFHKVGAMQSGEEKSLANLSVHLTGSCPAMTRWSIGPKTETEGATISLAGESGKVTLHCPDAQDWYFSSTTDDKCFLPAESTFDTSRTVTHQIETGLDGNAAFPNWEDAYRAIDLADTASESVRRGKTLPISNARLTEEDTFKSLMAAGGCLIVLVLPFLLLLVSLVDGLQLPYNKTIVERIGAGDRTASLPADLNALTRVSLENSDQELKLLGRSELYREYGIHEKGVPEAYSSNRNEITVAPIPEKSTAIVIAYEGSFNIWKGWPLLLLLPIVFFLMLQLLKLVFPKPTASEA